MYETIANRATRRSPTNKNKIMITDDTYSLRADLPAMRKIFRKPFRTEVVSEKPSCSVIYIS